MTHDRSMIGGCVRQRMSFFRTSLHIGSQPWGKYRKAAGTGDRREVLFERASLGKFCRSRGNGFRLAALASMIVCGATNIAAADSGPTADASNTAPPAPSASLLPSDRMAKWNPGLMSTGGIPNRTAIYKTLSPSGQDDTAAIQAALNSAPAGQVVMLSPGTFIVNDILVIGRPITLRGSGAGVTKLVKTNGARPRTATIISGANGILTPVNPGSYSHDEKPVIIVGPSRWNNGPDIAASQDLTSDGARGSHSVTIADAKTFKAGMFVLLDEVSGASWQPTPAGFADGAPKTSRLHAAAGWLRSFLRQPAPAGSGGGAQVWQGDRVAWNMHYPPAPGDDIGTSDAQGPYDKTPGVLPVCMSWFSRSDRATNEIKEIASISGNTVTFTSPLTISYRTSHRAQLTPYTTDPNTGRHAANNRDVHVLNAGVEDLSIYGGT